MYVFVKKLQILSKSGCLSKLWSAFILFFFFVFVFKEKKNTDWKRKKNKLSIVSSLGLIYAK